MQATLDVTLDPEKEYEIVNGIPEEKPMAGALQGGVVMRLGAKLVNYVQEHNLGEIYSPDTTFIVGQNQRLPDLAFVPNDQIPADGEPIGRWEFSPALAVEVVSPNDVFVKITGKVDEYLDSGVKQVWLVIPEQNAIWVYRSPFDVTVFQDDMELVSEDLFPGFRCRLSEIFRTRKPS